MGLRSNNYIPLNAKRYRIKRKITNLLKILFFVSSIFSIFSITLILFRKNTENIDLEDFEFLIPNKENGPITVNRKEDDGTKLNIFSMINDIEENTIFYDENEFDKLDKIVNVTQKYLCEYNDKKPSESFEGYYLTCPTHYTISINNTFYGRFKGDVERCNSYHDGRKVPLRKLEVNEDCGSKPIDTLKEYCENRKECLVRPCNSFFGKTCLSTYKYLYVDYYCQKDSEIKKPRIMINMFSNKIVVNSVYENAISEFYQYSKYHGYKLVLNRNRYDTEREIFYMKINTVIENLIKCLQEKSYDWIFWVDSDVVLANPNIKLETFLPDEKMDLIHFIAADDHNGLNCGVFFIRVHPWSLNFLMRANSYFYYHQEKYLSYADQSSINNVLTGSNDTDEHYIIVPKSWFNRYLSSKRKGDFLIHLAGKKQGKSERARDFRLQIKNDTEWTTAMNL